MPGTKTRRLTFGTIVLRVLLGIGALYLFIGATAGLSSMFTVNDLTHVLGENENGGENTYGHIKVTLFGWFSGLYEWVSGLFGHFSLPWTIIVVGLLFWGVRKFLRRGQNTAPAAPHSSSTS
jgi:hypothetical protein